MSKELRPYQIEAIQAVESSLEKGVDRQILSLATGTGKTVCAVNICKKYKRVLWVTHTQELIDQSAVAFIREYFDDKFANHVEETGYINYIKDGGRFDLPDFKMGVIKAENFQPDGNVIVSSMQTLHRRLERLDPNTFDAIVIDECHFAAAATWVKAINWFKPKLLLGLSASPIRADGLQLGDIFSEITYEYGIREGVRDGYLCELDAIRIKTTTSLDNVRTTAGELNQKDLSNEINTPSRNQLVVNSYLKYANGRQGIFFAVDIDHAIKLAEIFNEMGVICRAVSSDEELTPNRSEVIKAYKEGKIQVLTNCAVLTTGFDAPNTGIIGHASPTKSLTKYLQCTGRGTRLKDKIYVEKYGQNCIVLDFVDSTNRHNLVNSWTLDKELSPEDRVFITEEKRQKLLEERFKKSVKIEHEQKQDERISLLKIPRVKLSKSIKMQEDATEKQLKWIYDLGYPDDVHYTKQHCVEIINQLPASREKVDLVKKMGYDVSGKVITNGDVSAVLWEVELKKRKKEELQNKYKPNK